jgi:hypothetical protein
VIPIGDPFDRPDAGPDSAGGDNRPDRSPGVRRIGMRNAGTATDHDGSPPAHIHPAVVHIPTSTDPHMA